MFIQLKKGIIVKITEKTYERWLQITKLLCSAAMQGVCTCYLWTRRFDNMRRDSRRRDGTGRRQVFTGHRGPRESLSETEQYSDTFSNAQHYIGFTWWQTTGISGKETSKNTQTRKTSFGSSHRSTWLSCVVTRQRSKRDGQPAGVDLRLVRKTTFIWFEWTKFKPLNCCPVVDSLDE